jgi:hypothetical protein
LIQVKRRKEEQQEQKNEEEEKKEIKNKEMKDIQTNKQKGKVNK